MAKMELGPVFVGQFAQHGMINTLGIILEPFDSCLE